MSNRTKFSSRKAMQCPLFGDPKDLVESHLPSIEDVILCCQQERFKLGTDSEGNKEPLFSVIADNVSKKVETIYTKASIPTVSHRRVLEMIKNYHKKYVVAKSWLRFIEKYSSTKQKVDDFKASAKKLFDIAACKCADFKNCRCPMDKKVPILEQAFLFDQRGPRLGKIALVDVPETRKEQKRIKRCESDTLRLVNHKSKYSLDHKIEASCSSSVLEGSSESDSEVSDKEYVPSKKSKMSFSNQSRIDLKETSLVSQRFGISSRAAALIVSSAFKDANILEPSLIIDKNKIRREQKKVQKDLIEAARKKSPPLGLYFDGRKDKTLSNFQGGKKFYRKIFIEEHISLIGEPGSQYLGHVTPKSGSAEDICKCLIDFGQNEINGGWSKLLVVGSDGTAVNTGWKGGVIRKIEEKLDRSLQWIICLLHFNELPLRSLFHHVDGVTSGPKSFSGLIGSTLSGCEKLPVVSFQAIDSELPSISEAILKTLSKDQQYLLEISHALKSGNCSHDLSLKDPGPLNHARWNTLANRVMRKYIATSKPSSELKYIVEFIQRVYVPMWFRIRLNSSIKDGARYLFETIQKSRYLPKKYLKVVDDTITRNAFFASPENLLLSMLTDHRSQVRQDALQKIIFARENNANELRTFKIPKLNFEAKDYVDLIDWPNCKITSPPVLYNLSLSDLKERLSGIKDSEQISEWDFVHFPCHTQAVERTVKLVTTASEKVCGSHSRDGFIRSVLESRAKIPKFENKTQFM